MNKKQYFIFKLNIPNMIRQAHAMFIIFMFKTTYMVVVPCFKITFGGSYIYFFALVANIRFVSMYFYFINYIFLLAPSLEWAGILISAVTFSGIWFVFNFFLLYLLIKLVILGMQLYK